MNTNKIITQEERDLFAIEFSDWLDTLSPSDRVSVWSKDGSCRGLFNMDNKQLLEKFKRERNRRKE